MKNHLVAKILNDVSYALEILDVEFKPRAYARAARSVENLSKPIEDIYAEGGKKALDNIPGVGESIANKIEEIIKTRSLKYRNKLIRKIGFDFTELMNIEGLGPKMIKKLHEELGVKSLADLDKAAKEGRMEVFCNVLPAVVGTLLFQIPCFILLPPSLPFLNNSRGIKLI